MTTKHYYQQLIRIYSLESLAYFITGVLCCSLFYSYNFQPYITAGTGLFFSASVLFHLDRVMRIKWSIEKWDDREKPDRYTPLSGTHFLIGFRPGPTLNLAIFNQEGHGVGELKDANNHFLMWMIPTAVLSFLPRKYVLTDANGTVQAIYETGFGLNSQIKIMKNDGQLVGVYKQNRDSPFKMKATVQNQFGIEQYEGAVHHASAFTVKQIFHDKQLLEYESGWLPRDCSRYFINPNTPVLTFHANASEDAKLIGYCYCIDLLQLQNH